MAVQAQHFSNPFSPDLRSRAPEGVLDGLRMNRSHGHLMGHPIHNLDPKTVLTRDADPMPAAFTNATATPLSGHINSDLICNPSSSRKRGRDEAITNMQAAIYQHAFNSSTATAVSPRGLSFPVLESAASLSRDSPAATLQPFYHVVSPELLSQHNNETHALLRYQIEWLRLGMEESRMRYCMVLLATLGRHAIKKLREKEAELQNANRINAELEEKARQVSAECIIWFNIAKNNESLAANLRARIEQALIQDTAAASMPSEGYGDSVDNADDAQSCCYDINRSTSSQIEASESAYPAIVADQRRLIVCKVCRVNEVSVLVLPCKHLCLCKACDDGVRACPVCRFHKNASVQIFLS